MWEGFYQDLIDQGLYDTAEPDLSGLLQSYRTGLQLKGPVFQFHAIVYEGPVAVGIVTVSLTPSGVRMLNLYVKPSHRRRGYARDLLAIVQDLYEGLHGVYTPTAKALYESQGIAPYILVEKGMAIKYARFNYHARD